MSTNPGLEPDSVDMSYSRWLMVHLNRPVDAMRAIYAALKPGGVIEYEEADVSAVYAEPTSGAYVEMRGMGLEAGRQRGVDYAGGGQLTIHGRRTRASRSFTWTPITRTT